MAEKSHSILGASSSHRWLPCPGSIRLSEGLPNTTSEYAAEGTAAHELGHMCLMDDTNALDHLGEVIKVNEQFSFPVTEEMAEAVQVYLDTVRADYAVVGKSAELRFEHQFRLDWLREGLYGTNDALVGEPFGVLRVYDYKHGRGVAVDVSDNSQLMYYGLGASHGDAYEEVELVIVQPRGHHPDGPVRRCRMPIDQLTKWGSEVLLPGAQATEDPNAKVVAGEHCKFCPALGVCRVQQDSAIEVVKDAFSSYTAAPPSPEVMTLAELQRVLDKQTMVEGWMNACRAYARSLLDSGKVTPNELGYKLVEGRSSRDWKNPEEAAGALEMLVGEDAYVPKKLVSPAQAEKILKGAEGKKLLAPLISRSPGKPQLAPLNDDRAAIQPAIEAFTEVVL